MAKSICLEDLCRQRWSGLGSLRDVHVVYDTNTIGYVWKNVNVEVVITTGVMDELWVHNDKFPDESIRDFGYVVNPIVYREMASPKDEKLIKQAASEYPKTIKDKNGNPYKAYDGNIGWVDIQQIDYALRRARQGKKTIILSDDWDIKGAVIGLAKRLECVKDNVMCISVQDYLKRKYGAVLNDLSKADKRRKLNEIKGQHRYIA